MPRNQTSTNANAAGAASARVAKSRTPRVTASKHSKPSATSAVTSAEDATVIVPQPLELEPTEKAAVVIASLTEEPGETIAKLAYGYWEERGCQGGDPLADWVRAEDEYRQSLATA